uniref:Uncharacterized protein n=1 Tax=Cucumis melo TaxID=3656 RepID=A0A9I9ELZ2_CUCME
MLASSRDAFAECIYSLNSTLKASSTVISPMNLFRRVGEQNNNGGSKQIGGDEHNGGVDHNSGDKHNGGSDGYSKKKRASEKKWMDSI